VAPELDQSGVSHSLSLNDPLRLRRSRSAPFRGAHADRQVIKVCAISIRDARSRAVRRQQGRNVAEDVVYSGTIARPRARSGHPVIRAGQEFSIETRHAPLWDTALKFGPDILRRVIDAACRRTR
jgi:5'-nucleotidase